MVSSTFGAGGGGGGGGGGGVLRRFEGQNDVGMDRCPKGWALQKAKGIAGEGGG